MVLALKYVGKVEAEAANSSCGDSSVLGWLRRRFLHVVQVEATAAAGMLTA
jgi:hypothetical protein